MFKEGLVSVIVPVYNVEPYLRKCLDSIARQTYRNFEVIVVDDGSMDSSGAICDEYAVKFPETFQVVHKTNGGLSSARNRGLDEARGEYVCFVDSDDWIAPNLVENAMRTCLKYAADIVCFGMTRVYPIQSVSEWIPSQECVLEQKDALRKMFQGNEFGISACDKLFRREIFRSIRFPEGVINEDAAVMFLLFAEARRVACLPEHLYYYRCRAGSITTSTFNEKKLIVIKHAAETLKWAESKYPDLLPEARGYYAEKLIEILSRLQTLSRADRAAYQEVERTHKKELRKLYAYLPNYKWRVKYHLIMSNTYGFLLKLYERLFRS